MNFCFSVARSVDQDFGIRAPVGVSKAIMPVDGMLCERLGYFKIEVLDRYSPKGTNDEHIALQ
jgi:hypothetical protein